MKSSDIWSPIFLWFLPFSKTLPCHVATCVTLPLEKHGKKTGHHLFDTDFCWSCFEGPLGSSILRWLNFPFRSHMPPTYKWHMQKIPFGDAKNSQCFLCWGWNVFFAIVWNDKKRGFCCTSRFTSARLEARLIENSFIVHGAAIEQKVLQRPDLGFQKTSVTISWETKRGNHPTPPNATVSPPRNCRPYEGVNQHDPLVIP